ncbi:hypothetical protein [Variovorax ginsengisoli]|uniref:Uncharacterized protein n=1 Tax=Variovorax ginsengisoli TaxID=363844 RepID=A0ABT8SAZ4_9BURK|nr:hypothetical protein [Variovorax ginsengisoli]MDN8616289.1 hypothetical protein [Variovorax ginsengisoli]MDO1535459.1 hypothetical protein [Variovorax ginsengisoli]
MAQTKRIHCVSDQEPTSYHAGSAYAINLNIECSGNAIDAAEATAAKAAFHNFLAALPRVEFHLYELKRPGADWEAHRDVQLQTFGTSPSSDPRAIVDWLDSLQPTGENGYWVLSTQTAGILDKADKAVEQAHFGATHLLRGSHSWSAPVGHRFGLTRLIEASVPASATRKFIALPHIPGHIPASPIPAAQVDTDRWDVDYPFDDVLGDVTCRSNSLSPQSSTLPFLTPEGFLKVNKHAMELRRFLDDYETGWTGIVASLPALLGAALSHDSLPWTVDPNHGTWTFAHSVPAWQVIAGLTTALDPLIVALLRPGSAAGAGDEIVGDVLLSLVTDVLEAAAEMPPEKLELTPGAVAGALRDLLRHSPLLDHTATPREFISALRDAHGLTGATDGSGVAGRLVDVLLNAVADGAFAPLSWDEAKALSGSHSETGGVKTATGFLQDPYGVVIDANHRLHEEAGAERTILRLFNFAAAELGGIVPDLLFRALVPNPPSNDPDHDEFRRKLLAAWNSYGSRLEGSFNGAEAIRRSASADFVDVLQRDAAQYAEPAPSDLIATLEAADFFSARIAGTNTGVFGGIASALPVPLMGLLGNPPPDLQFRARYLEALGSLKRHASTDAVFVADTKPAPLPIQVSASLSASDLDSFSTDFNGICIALRRIDHPADSTLDAWSHANLAELAWSHGGHRGSVLGLRQWLPSVQDARAPAFIDYDGFPFASQTIARVSASGTQQQLRKPFYSADVAQETAFDGGWAPSPSLVYGRNFEAYSFATTNSGSIPNEIQEANQPWMPAKALAPVNAPIARASYSRRTNIGTASIDELGTSKRFAKSLPNVRSLAADYPRVALSASMGALGSADLLREPDGSGILAFPSAQEGVQVEFTDLQWSGEPAMIRVLFFDKAALIGSADPVSLQFDSNDLAQLHSGSAITLTLSGNGRFRARLGSGAPKEETRVGASSRLWWIRVQLESKSSANFSFSNPFPRSNASGATPPLLMAPSSVGWTDGLADKVSARISSPRVVFFDFERWYRNPALLRRTFGAATSNGKRLQDWLLLAYVRRTELLNVDGKENFSSALDRLPDPAVEKLRVELVCLDSLNATLPLPPKCVEIDLKKRVASWATNCTAEVETLKLPALRKMFDDLATLMSLSVEIESTHPVLELSASVEGSCKVNVPAGVVAELRVSALVPKSHFEVIDGHPPVIDPGVSESAVLDGNWQVFHGNALQIETMLDGLVGAKPIEMASRVISCSPQPQVREYKVISDGSIGDADLRRRWRLVSDAAVSTQRWRPGGLPLYNVIDPRRWADGNDQNAALPIRNPGQSPTDELRLFEDEIFLARGPEEAETVWKSIDPQMPEYKLGHSQPACTVLQSIPWEAPSATYMRHRFQLRSRYAGALTSVARGTVAAWQPGAEGSEAWTRRVAVLADRNRALVTRPQLRALLPLTTSPHERGTPPIIAFLQEPPFSEGGLADRVAADMKLGFGFGFSNGAGTVGILDARKEFGPDPGLDYRRISDSEAVDFSLASEGPVGLTFDIPRANAAAFSNSIISMTPARSDGTVLERKYEEHFTGIFLRRYLAPEWLSDQDPTTEAVPVSTCLWFDLDAIGSPATQVVFESGSEHVLRATAGYFEVSTALIDKSGRDAGRDWVPVAPCTSRGRYSVLHAPVAPGRFSASIFLSRNQSAPSLGTTNQPLLIASFEWSLPKEDARATVQAPGGRARHCVASFPTSLAWSRTARDFKTVLIEPQRLGGNNDLQEVQAEFLVARLTKGGLRFETSEGGTQRAVTVRPSTLPEFLLYRHRHLAVIGTRPAAGLGKPVQVFAGTAMVRRRAETFPVPADFGVASQLHLAEYEVRSQPLASAFSLSADGKWTPVASIPAMAATAYVDLTATAASWDRELWLFFRFASEARKDKFSKLGLRVELPDVEEVDGDGLQTIKSQPGGTTFVVDLPADSAAFGVELLLLPDPNGTTKALLTLVHADGGRQQMSVNNFPRPDKKTKGFLLSLAAQSEFWTDFSMLHFPSGHLTKSPAAWEFNFELLFSKTSDLPAAKAVQAENNSARDEVQARIVSMSPPIPIIR